MQSGDRVNVVCTDEDGHRYRLPGTYRGTLAHGTVVKLDFGGMRLRDYGTIITRLAKQAGFNVDEDHMTLIEENESDEFVERIPMV